MKKFITAAVLSFIFLVGGLASAQAATLTVRTTADSNNNFCGLNCSLREAVNAAAPGDTIEFASPLFDTPRAVSLTLGELIITKTLMINGRGENLTYITANNLSRVFDNQDNLTLNGLTIQDGRSSTFGGGIYNRNGSRLLINDSTIFGNSVSASSAYGGGIYNALGGIVEIKRSTISGNFTFAATGFGNSWGGGIWNEGTLVIESSLLLDNRATGGNGTFAQGGAIYNAQSTVYLTNSTVSGNTASGGFSSNATGGGIFTNSTVSIINTTITGNSALDGGGLYKNSISTSIYAVNTIISGNSAPTDPNLRGSLSININNFIDGDAQLAPIANNGGTMLTHLPLPGSPVINAGSECVLTANACGIAHAALTDDQRGAGFRRRAGGAVDIGAIESSQVVLNDNSSGAGSLSATIADASAGDTITFDSTFFSQPRTITAGITINKNLNIIGPGANLLTLDAGNGFRALHIDGGATVVFNGVRIFRGRAFGTDAGGGVLITPNSTLYATGMVIDSCSAPDSLGGAVYNTGTIYLTSSTISNSSARGGGGMFNDGTAYLINSTVSGNQATSEKGAGMYNALGRFSFLLNTTITNNQSNTTAGAGIWNETFSNPSTSVRARNTIIAGNISGNGTPVDYVGGITDLGNNLINNNNPGLAPLGNYGGATPTHALTGNSPALNSGSDCVLTANACGIAHAGFPDDQRGTNAPRKIGAAVDIGSSERNISIDQTTLPNGTQTFAYNQTLTATRAASFAEGLWTSEKIDLFNTNSLFAPFTFSIVPAVGQSLPPGLTLDSNGTISGMPMQSGTFIFTVKATDTDSMAGAQTYSLTIAAFNIPPTISGATVLRQAGSPVSNSTIATVDDVENGANGVSVTVTSANPSNGVTVSSIVNTNGNVTANVSAGCSAADAAFTLMASDGNKTANGTLTVNVSANTAPSLAYPGEATVLTNNSLTISPTNTADNGTVSYSLFSVSPSITTAPTVNPSTGAVSITNANPVGVHIITVRATDNCGLITDASFTLNVTSATKTVTKTEDTNDGACDADCSLREAIAAVESGNTIEFASPLFDTPQTITLEGGNLYIFNKTLTINGRGAQLTAISGNNLSRIFNNDGGNLTLNGLTITGGKDIGAGGGGIYNNGTMTINNCSVSGNSTVGGEGGGIYNRSFLTINNSTISGNTATNYDGGGILSSVFSTLVINNSTISGNSTASNGGGIFVRQSNLKINNSTISANSAQSTGGGIYDFVTDKYFQNTIISGNSASGSPDLHIFGAAFFMNDSNLIDGDAGLAPLGFYGGATQTHALLPNSPALNAGNNCVLTANACGSQNPALPTDQRGANAPRRIGANTDIGAFEQNIFFNQTSLPNGSQNVSYSGQLSVARLESFVKLISEDQLAPFAYSIIAGALPPGLSLDANTGIISGTPTEQGTYVFTVKATDTDGIAAAAQYEIQVFAPTAAFVSVGGRVSTANGNGIRNVIVMLTDTNGNILTARTGTFGYFRFSEIEVGETYVISISAKKFIFNPASQILTVNEELTDVNFVANQ